MSTAIQLNQAKTLADITSALWNLSLTAASENSHLTYTIKVHSLKIHSTYLTKKKKNTFLTVTYCVL